MKTKLTIIIPTYNRPEEIKKQVRLVLPQLQENVSLVVFDNHSDMPVSSYFTDNELSLFKIIRNKVNIGGSPNICRALESVDSGWAWTLGDDDPILENAVEIILRYIEKYPDVCYINFGTKKDLLATNFTEFLSYLGITGAFGISFFMSHCLFNMSKLHKYMIYYHLFVSTQIGQICLIIKYLEINSKEKTLFSKEKLISYNAPGGWNPLKLIVNSSLLIDSLYADSNKYRNNLFKGIGDMYLTILTQSDAVFLQRIYYFRYISFKLGFLNLLRYNTILLIGFFIKIIMPLKIFQKIRKIIANRYNNRI